MMFRYKTKNQMKKELAKANQEITELKKTHNNFKQVKDALISAAADWRKTFDSITDFVSLHDEDLKLIKKKNSTTTGSTRRRETRRPDPQVHWRRWLPWAFGGDIIEKDVM